MKNSRLLIVSTILMLLAGCPIRAQFAPAPGTGPGLPETIEAIDSARVTTRILYVTAHPDDESAAVLTYLARGLHADVALLSLTRGEGGQNALGPEQAPQLGLIRTQELLAATRGYGVKLYFTRAKDFGFSKTPEETEKVWGDQVLQDMVFVIRDFQPHIIINNWGGVHTGHGHHQATGLLTPKAAELAADKSYSNSGCDDCGPWKTSQILALQRGSEHPNGYVLPLDDISPLYGRSWRRLGLDAFASHRTQGITGFLGSPFLLRPIALIRDDGNSLDPGSLAVGLAEKYRSCAPAEQADSELKQAREAALQLTWKTAGQKLGRAKDLVTEAMRSCAVTGSTQAAAGWEGSLDLPRTASAIASASALVAGVDITAIADRNNLSIGESFHVLVRARCRPDVDCNIIGSRLVSASGFTQTGQNGDLDSGLTYELRIDKDAEPAFGVIGSAATAKFEDWEHPYPFAYSQVWINFKLAGREYTSRVPVKYFDANSTRAELVPLRLVPAYTLAIEPKSAIEVPSAGPKPVDVLLRVHSYSTKSSMVSVGLNAPMGWAVPANIELKFEGSGDKYAKIKVMPPPKLSSGNVALTAYAKRGDETFTTSIEPLQSMPSLLWQEPAQCIVHAFDINVPKNLHIGYITAEGEPIPDALRMLGIQVDLLDAAALNFGDLSKYDAIVVGVRAYELRSELPGANQRLLDYAANGGTLVVQYERDFAWDGKNYAPYPAKISSSQPGQPLPRITDETAAVNFLKPDDRLLNSPNKITGKDFDGWVQERGLYYWTEFDSAKYTPLLSMHDPGEKDLNGALVYGKIGKGTYIYTGLAFFRQLPEGVPGAYRLFVNLLSASRSQ